MTDSNGSQSSAPVVVAGDPSQLRVVSADAAEVLKDARRIVQLDPDLADSAMTPDQLLSLYIGFAKVKKKIEAFEKLVSGRMKALEQTVVDQFQDLGQQSIKRHGATLYLQQEIWPKLPECKLPDGMDPESDEAVAYAEKFEGSVKDVLIEALQADPSTDFLVTPGYNSNKLRSWMLKDLPKNAEGLPELPAHLVGKLTASEQYKAKVTGA